MISTPNTIMVAGSRLVKYEDEFYKKQIFKFLDMLHSVNEIKYLIDGGHAGVDEVVRAWRTERNVPGETFYADWEEYGYRAGVVRNKQLVESISPIHLMVLFPGSLGTNSMRAFAEAQKIGIVEVDLFETEEDWNNYINTLELAKDNHANSDYMYTLKVTFSEEISKP